MSARLHSDSRFVRPRQVDLSDIPEENSTIEYRPPLTKRLYQSGMHSIAPLLRRIAGPDPTPSNRLRHWVFSLGSIYDAASLAELGVPWWTYGAIDEVERWLTSLDHPARVLEYGSGASTLWLAGRCGTVDSIEHDLDFAEVAKALCSDAPNVTIHPVAASESHDPRIASGREGHEHLDFTDYIETGGRIGGTFDLVIVDGRARSDALSASLPLLAPGGRIVFDNSRRARYRNAIDTSGLHERKFRGLTPTLPYPDQTSVLSADAEVD